MRYIGLLDCNNFFVSCERLFRPDLAKKPVAVLSSNDGCIVARSPEVKAMGVPMGLPFFQAKQLVDMDQVTIFSSNFTLYRDISRRVMKVLADEVGQCEIYSVDEAFFLVENSSEVSLKKLRQRMIQKTGIPVSIGVGKTKTLAKAASEIAKKDEGICVLDETQSKYYAPKINCGSVWGLGRATARKLKDLEVVTVADFLSLERRIIRQQLGVGGERIYDELRGTVVFEFGKGRHDVPKSVTSTRSFAETTQNINELKSAVAYHVAHVSAKLRRKRLCARALHVEMRASRHGDFSHRRAGFGIELPEPTNSLQTLTKHALRIVEEMHDAHIPYKKAGVVMSGLVEESVVPQSLFDDGATQKHKAIDAVVDSVHEKFGFDALHSATILPNADRSSRKLRSRSYTTTWKDIPRVRAI